MIIITRSTMDGTLKGATYREQAADLIGKFPHADHSVILHRLIALALLDVRHGNKREERAGCDLLNCFQDIAAELEAEK